tara:strand:- start:5 stop:238 length:234 start_codon:yes stop_codon:yes gene_type:complete
MEKIVCNEDYILRSSLKHGHIRNSQDRASISIILKILKEGLESESSQYSVSGRSFMSVGTEPFRVGENLEKIMLRED